MDWKGVNQHSTPVDNRLGYCMEQYNAIMQVNGELQRRPGHANTSIAKQSGAILGIASAAPSHGNFLTFQVGGTIQGFGVTTGVNDPLPDPPWDRPKWKKPVGVVGFAVAPVITNVTPTGSAYPAGNQTFLPTITYDGLSGPLLYSWVGGAGPGGPPSPTTSTASTYACNYDGFHIPGAYINNTLQVSTTQNGFVSNLYVWTFTIV